MNLFRTILPLASLLLLGCGSGQESQPTNDHPKLTAATRFEFHSDFWVNLHQRLYTESDLPPQRPSSSTPDPALRDDDLERWNGAINFYRRWLPAKNRNRLTPIDQPLVAINQALGRSANTPHLRNQNLDPRLADQLEDVAVVYRDHRWREDDRLNREWIGRLAPMLAQLGEEVARDLAEAYRVEWPRTPLRVEVSVNAGPVGAYTAGEPPIILITSDRPSYSGVAAFEMVFHEASHVIGSPTIEPLIARESAAQGKAVPESLWHAILFYTAGEIVRRRVPGYEPYAYRNGLYARVPQWDLYEHLLRAHWQPYLEKKQPMEGAVRAIIAGLPSQSL